MIWVGLTNSTIPRWNPLALNCAARTATLCQRLEGDTGEVKFTRDSWKQSEYVNGGRRWERRIRSGLLVCWDSTTNSKIRISASAVVINTETSEHGISLGLNVELLTRLNIIPEWDEWLDICWKLTRQWTKRGGRTYRVLAGWVGSGSEQSWT